MYKPSEFVDYRGHKMWPHVARYIEMRLRGMTNRQISDFTGEKVDNVEWAAKKAIRLGLMGMPSAYFTCRSIATGERYYFKGIKALADSGFCVTQVYKAAKGRVESHAGFTWARCTKAQYEAAMS